MPGVTVPKPDGAFYLFPRDRRADGFVRFLPPAVDGDQGRPGAGRGVRRGRRRLGAHLLRGGERILEPAMERLGRFLK